MEAFNFEKIKLPSQKQAALARDMTSWKNVYTAIAKLPQSDKSLTELSEMIAFEMRRDAPRAQLLARLHMRLNNMRSKMEYERLMAKAGVPAISKSGRPAAKAEAPEPIPVLKPTPTRKAPSPVSTRKVQVPAVAGRKSKIQKPMHAPRTKPATNGVVHK